MELIQARPERGQAEEVLDEFESALAGRGSVDLADYLPSPADAAYRIVLRELIRIDLDFRWRKRRRPIPLAGYRHRFPEAFADAKDRAAIAYEEYRLRVLAGETPSREDYEKAWNIAADDWPAPDAASGLGRPDLPATRLIEPGNEERARTVAKPSSAANDRMPDEAPRGDAPPVFPAVGEEFLGFRLLRKLGSGAFGCVYLAEQAALANRPVALKISEDSGSESQRLAQLQHTNIVPIYSTHRIGSLQAVCMPYFGATTLADVIQQTSKSAALPTSGRELVSTLHARRSTAPGSYAPAALPAALTDAEPPAPAQVPEFGSTVILDKLSSLNYAQAVLWLAERIADGLAHAHERGIWHCDLKPANILLTDEGQPMVLDFNLAVDAKMRLGLKAVRGGTIAYMAPEHLTALADHQGAVDGRSDLYSLGVILYQMLTGRHPSPPPIGQPVSETIRRSLSVRRLPPPRLRQHNPAVSPATEAIVRRCLEPDPDRRYPSARALQEDVQRHLADLPLRHTREPSWRERAHKWMRRHPRLASSGSVAVLAALVLCGMAGAWALRSQRLGQLEADATLRRFRQDAGEARFLLTHVNDQAYRERGLAQCRNALDHYQVLENQQWRQLPAVQSLPAVEQSRLTGELGEMLLMYASANLPPAADTAEQRRDVQTALDSNERAGACFVPEHRPRAWSLQRANLMQLLGRKDDARRLQTEAESQPLRTAHDHYLVAKERFHAGKYREALTLLHQVTDMDPENFWAIFLQGRCYDLFGDNRAAVASYRTCIALQPELYGPWFNRGLAQLRLKEHRRAVADFNRAEKLRADQPELYFNRALAHLALAQREQALRDLNVAETLGCALTRIYFVRSRVHEQLGDRESAKRDREEGLRREPTDDLSWSARGFARLSSDPQGALHDFNMALKLNPRSLPALENKAHVLAELLHRTEDAVAALDQAVQQYPDHVAARASRGVLQARLGKRAAAHQDAEEALLRDAEPPTQYQVAGIYALTSRQQPDDARRALALLGSALRSGYGVDFLDTDADLDPVRDTPEFRRLAQGAKALAASQK